MSIASLAGYVVLIAMLMNFRGVGRVWQILRWGLVVIGVVMSIRSGSRGQLFAMTGSTILFLPMSRRISSTKGFVATLAGAVSVGALIMWLYGQYAIWERWEWESMVEAYQSSRAEMVGALLAAWLDSSPVYWLIGLGSSAAYDPGIVGGYPHVVLIEVLCEEGLVGFVLFCGIVVLSMRSILRVYGASAPYPDARGVLAALGALFLFVFVLSFKQGSMLGSPYLFAFAVMLGKFEQLVNRQKIAQGGGAEPPAGQHPVPV